MNPRKSQDLRKKPLNGPARHPMSLSSHMEAVEGQYATATEWVAHKPQAVGDWVQKPREMRLRAPTIAESDSEVSGDDALDVLNEEDPEQPEKSRHEKLMLLGQGLSASQIQKATKKRKRKHVEDK